MKLIFLLLNLVFYNLSACHSLLGALGNIVQKEVSDLSFVRDSITNHVNKGNIRLGHPK